MKPASASSTALLIARALVLAETRTEWKPLLPPGSVQLTRLFLQESKRASWFELAQRNRLWRAGLLLLERAMLPGVWLHWLVRKAWIDEITRAAVAAGCQQLVVLGAGLDTLAWRWQHNVTASFEIDHPATQSLKQRAKVFQTAPLLIAANLDQESVSKLLHAQPLFFPQGPTLFVAEGLLMYLDPQRVAALLKELATLSAPGSQLCFTFMEKQAGVPLAFQGASPFITWWLRWRSEPFRWGLARAEAGEFLARHGWRLLALSDPGDWRRDFLAPYGLEKERLAIGEVALLAELAV